MPQKLIYNTSVEKSLDNLKAMGLRVQLLPEGDNDCYLFIDLDSLVRMIERRIPYANKKVTIEKSMMVVYMWRKQ